MAVVKCRVHGKLITSVRGPKLEGLRVVAYRSSRASGTELLSSCPVKADASFDMSFESGSVDGKPMDMAVMPIPAVIESREGVAGIEESITGLSAPRVDISANDWVLTNKVYTKELAIKIPDTAWSFWEWLSEEFTVIGRLVKKVGAAFLPVPEATVRALDVDLPVGKDILGSATTNNQGNFTIAFRRVGFFVDRASYFSQYGRYATEAWPNVVFDAYQKAATSTLTLISEDPGSDARPKEMWDVAHRILYVELVTEKGIINDEEYPPIPAGDNFLFHGIGVVDHDSLKDGYATTGPLDHLPNRKDCPFGRRLNIKGQFDASTPNPPAYYQVRYARWRGTRPPDETEFETILGESWSVSKYNTSTNAWEPIVIEPISDAVAGEMVYKIPDYTDDTLTKKTRLIRWTTHREDSGIRRYPDGKYDLLVKAWDANGDPVILNSSHPENNRLTVMIDNTWPEALLTRIGPHDILRTDELLPYTPVCPTLIKGKYCEIIFDATDAKGHLLNYRLSLITGHNFCVDETIKEYDGKSSTGADEVFKVTKKHKAAGTGAVTTTHPRDDVKPPGGFPDEAVVWDTGSPDVVPCAYQVRLRVWDRVIDGYEFIHWTEDTMHFTVEP